jgi:hypothetical protein
MDIEIAPGKRAGQAYSFDDIAIVPSRRTRDPEMVSTAWQIDAYKFDLPMLAEGWPPPHLEIADHVIVIAGLQVVIADRGANPVGLRCGDR